MNTKPNRTSSSNTHHGSTSNPFARAIQEIGGATVKQGTALPGQMVNDAFETIFGTHSQPQTPEDTASSNLNPFAKALENQSTPEKLAEFELEKRQAVRHKEVQMTEVFNLREAKDKQIIKELQEQLRGLAREVKTLDGSVKTAIHADVVDPGTYHVHFFQQLLNFVVLMRKRVQEANTWIENFHSRAKKQGAFWGQVYNKKGGTQYLMSQEHQVARNVG